MKKTIITLFWMITGLQGAEAPNLNKGKISPELCAAVEAARQKYCCTKCDKSLSTKISYTRHLKSHEGEKPFRCGVCSYKTNQNANLKKHERIHTKEKPFGCNQCNYKSTSSCNLETHKWVHKKERPHNCPDCEYGSVQKFDLRKHAMKIHNKCIECLKVFPSESEASEHLKLTHKKIVKN